MPDWLSSSASQCWELVFSCSSERVQEKALGALSKKKEKGWAIQSLTKSSYGAEVVWKRRVTYNAAYAWIHNTIHAITKKWSLRIGAGQIADEALLAEAVCPPRDSQGRKHVLKYGRWVWTYTGTKTIEERKAIKELKAAGTQSAAVDSMTVVGHQVRVLWKREVTFQSVYSWFSKTLQGATAMWKLEVDPNPIQNAVKEQRVTLAVKREGSPELSSIAKRPSMSTAESADHVRCSQEEKDSTKPSSSFTAVVATTRTSMSSRTIPLETTGVKDEPLEPHEANGKYIVACIGDSTTKGTGLEHAETYPVILQEILSEDFAAVCHTPVLLFACFRPSDVFF
jgi:hypothetical protein